MKNPWYTCGGCCPCKCKPWVYWVLSTACIVTAIVAFIFAILVKTVFENSFINGVNDARFIDNTVQTTDCSNMFVGDSTCSGLAYQAWLLNSTEARDMCLSSQAPSTRPLTSSSGWCDTKQEGCVKPDVCLKGMPHDFFAFNVTNPAEILRDGAKPVVQELRPVHSAKTSDRIEASVDVDKWNNEGIAHWNESNTFVFADKDETDLLQQKIVVPNLALLSTVTRSGVQLNTIEIIQMLGLCGTYQRLANMVISLIGRAPASIVSVINARFGDIRSAMKAQYFGAGLTRLLGSQEIDIEAMGPMLRIIDPTLDTSILPPASMAIDYFAYAFGCVVKQDANHSCKFNPDSQADVDLERRINGTFSDTSRTNIFDFIMNTNFSDTTGAGSTLVLLLRGLLSASEAAAWSAHLNYAGSYGLSNYNVMRYSLFPFTNSTSPAYDPDYEYYPRFIKMTVGQMLGWDNQAFMDKFTGMPISFGFAKPVINGAPTEQYRSSKIPDQRGLSYFRMYNGQTQNCAFDPDCMAQDSFKKDGTCTANAVCTPNYAAGWDAKFIPGTLNGKGTDEYHKKDATAKLFVGQIFSAATLKNIETNADWRGVKVDVWTLADIDFRNENCDGSDPNHGSRGIDCDSPYETFNLGYFASPDPSTTQIPVYASLPHFTMVDGTSSRPNYRPSDRVTIVSCTGDSACEGNREFSVNVLTEPISGALLDGQQRLQLNVKFPPTANGKTGEMTAEMLMPSFWLNKHQSAFDFQLSTVKQIQSGSSLFNTLMGILIAIGVILLVCGGILIFFGYRRRSMLRSEAGEIVDIK